MKTLARRLWRNDFSRGGIFLTISSVAANFLGYLFNTLAGRALGPSGYGEIATLFSYSYITAVSFTVLSTIIIQKIASSKLGIGYARSLELWFIEKIKKTLPLTLIALILIPYLPRITNLKLESIFILVTLILLSFFSSFYSSALQGLRLFAPIAVMAVAGSLIKLLGPIAVMAHLDGLMTIYIFILISSFLVLLIGYVTLHRSYSPREVVAIQKIDKRLGSLFLSRQFLLTTGSLLAITLFSNLDIIYVKKFFSASDAGIYASWSLFAKIILYALGPLMQVSFVFFASHQTRQVQHRTLVASLIGLGVTGVAAYIVYSFFGGTVVTIFFGSRFLSVIPFMKYAALFGSFYTVIFYLNNFFLAKNSRAALILFFSLPIYIFLLFKTDRHIGSIMWLNVMFSAGVSAVSLSLFAAKQYIKRG